MVTLQCHYLESHTFFGSTTFLEGEGIYFSLILLLFLVSSIFSYSYFYISLSFLTFLLLHPQSLLTSTSTSLFLRLYFYSFLTYPCWCNSIPLSTRISFLKQIGVCSTDLSPHLQGTALNTRTLQPVFRPLLSAAGELQVFEDSSVCAILLCLRLLAMPVSFSYARTTPAMLPSSCYACTTPAMPEPTLLCLNLSAMPARQLAGFG